MIRGRESVHLVHIGIWADQAEQWLREQFRGKDLVFHTSWDAKKHTITLSVFRHAKNVAGGLPVHHEQLLFEVTEPADKFITHTTLTKIILVS